MANLIISLVLTCFFAENVSSRYPVMDVKENVTGNGDISNPQLNTNYSLKGSGRMVNALESTTEYPWLVHIERYNRKEDSPYNLVLSSCTGSIISKSMTVLTAAHCVCKFYDRQKDGDRFNQNCKRNSEHNGPANQQTDITMDNLAKLNYIEFQVGNKNHEKGINVEVRKAYVMLFEVGGAVIDPLIR